MFKVNDKDTWRRSGVFFVNFEHISHLVLVFLFLTLNRKMPVGENVPSQILDMVLNTPLKSIIKQKQPEVLCRIAFHRTSGFVNDEI